MAYNRIKHVKQLAQELLEERGYLTADEFDGEDIEYIGMEAQCNYEGVCEILGIKLPKDLGPVLGDA